MSSIAESLHTHNGVDCRPEIEESHVRDSWAKAWEFAHLGEAEICKLVRQLFFPATGKAPKQVVFSAVEEETDVGGICLQVAEALAACVNASVAVIEANAFSRDVGRAPEHEKEDNGSHWARMEWMRANSNQLGLNFWLVPGPVFWSGPETVGSPPWVCDRLSELRLDFDYTLVHAPAAGLYSGTGLLGQASDGLVLVIEANRTRRVSALKTKENLQAANVRVLGTVLSGRTFPIPEQIYKRI